MSEAMAYVGRYPCGCVVVATAIKPGRERDVAREVAGWIRDGLAVDRVPSEQVRELIGAECATPELHKEPSE